MVHKSQPYNYLIYSYLWKFRRLRSQKRISDINLAFVHSLEYHPCADSPENRPLILPRRAGPCRASPPHQGAASQRQCSPSADPRPSRLTPAPRPWPWVPSAPESVLGAHSLFSAHSKTDTLRVTFTWNHSDVLHPLQMQCKTPKIHGIVRFKIDESYNILIIIICQ